MRIRTEQLQALFAKHNRDFVERLEQHVADCFPKHIQHIGKGAITTRLHQAVGEAKHYGLESQLAIAFYTDVCIALAPRDIAVIPGALDVLDDDHLDGDSKARIISDLAVAFLESPTVN